MVVVVTAPVRDLSEPVSPASVSFDEIVRGTGRCGDLGLGTRTPASVTLLPRARFTGTRTQKLLGRLFFQLGNIVSSMAFALFLFLAVGPHLFPYQTMTMLTGSMVPTINPGDVAVDTQVSVYDLKPGDVITYRIPVDDNRIVSHRIVSVTGEPDGSLTVQTKGDANPDNDPWKANFPGGTIWRVDTVIPKMGEGIRWFRQPGVAKVAVYVAPALVSLMLLSVIWKPARRKRSEPDPHDVPFTGSGAR
ncbi:signal peptidase I [Kineosporia succinea]|nr:signal peptidase I [Kineosporia succinea]